jgi:hypothetical protein
MRVDEGEAEREKNEERMRVKQRGLIYVYGVW